MVLDADSLSGPNRVNRGCQSRHSDPRLRSRCATAALEMRHRFQRHLDIADRVGAQWQVHGMVPARRRPCGSAPVRPRAEQPSLVVVVVAAAAAVVLMIVATKTDHPRVRRRPFLAFAIAPRGSAALTFATAPRVRDRKAVAAAECGELAAHRGGGQARGARKTTEASAASSDELLRQECLCPSRGSRGCRGACGQLMRSKVPGPPPRTAFPPPH